MDLHVELCLHAHANLFISEIESFTVKEEFTVIITICFIFTLNKACGQLF